MAAIDPSFAKEKVYVLTLCRLSLEINEYIIPKHLFRQAKILQNLDLNPKAILLGAS